MLRENVTTDFNSTLELSILNFLTISDKITKRDYKPLTEPNFPLTVLFTR